ncbi:MAG: hypothetical protein DMG76_13720 [Acidobacteria bacterium]|nr:MAG: hypothetical protein DMG76_13720 [Acidobacteriota bacterium]
MGKWLLPRDRAVAKSVLHHKVFVAFNIGSPRTTQERKPLCQKRLASSLPAPSKAAILNAQTRKRKVRDRTLLNLVPGPVPHL